MKTYVLDFEVFEYDWLVVIKEFRTDNRYVIVNNRHQLEDFYNQTKDDMIVGFNIKGYDQFIYKGILSGCNPKAINDFIIKDGNKGYNYPITFRDVPMYIYDVIKDKSLKYYEGVLGKSIEETGVSFDIDRKLTDEEIEKEIYYCTCDVDNTCEVLEINYNDFKAQLELINMFGLSLDCMALTKPQLSARILGARRRNYNDEFNITIPTNLTIKKYKDAIEWYKNPINLSYDASFEMMVAGVLHKFGWGGLHSAIDKYIGEGYYVMADVASLYPNIMINNHYISRSCNGDLFKDIVAKRLYYKAKKDPLQAPLKIVINSTYGAMKDVYNPLYDPLQANNVCVAGQLYLLNLIEMLEEHCELIQTNTDGILVRLYADNDKQAQEEYRKIKYICEQWEKQVGLVLEFDGYKKVVQKDVNNYVIVNSDGHYKSKGAYVKKLGKLDYDLPIVNKAMLDYITKGVSVEETINSCDSLMQFQQVKKISSKYQCLMYDGVPIDSKCVRVFASTDENDGGITKLHIKGTIAKLESTPVHAFIVNDDVRDAKTTDYEKLDKQYYIDMACKRLKDFGYDVEVIN